MSDHEDSTPKARKPKGKKARRAARRDDLQQGPEPIIEQEQLEPVARSLFGLTLFTVVLITVAMVAIWFKLDVNRVFDVPKALALKVGGGGAFLAWLVYGLFGPGFAWRSFRLFAAPVFALATVVVISTFLSFDVSTSVYGVYERQFGLQGFLACVGLYAVTSSTLGGRRGAILGLSWLALLGGILGTYALLQSQGWDPFPFFFEKPHNKVYSFLGNATFAGNALALIFPISTLLAIVAGTQTLGKSDEGQPMRLLAWVGGFVGLVFLLVVPAVLVSGNQDTESRQFVYKFSLGLGVIFALGTAALGTWGPQGLRQSMRPARLVADAAGAGVLAACAFGIVMGLMFTRTRGAWVGSMVAVGVGFVLLPLLFREAKNFKLVRNLCWGALLTIALLFAGYVTQAEKICPEDPKGRCMLFARTIRSIPAAFDPNRTDYGKGQGTRRFLWSESPRVLLNHEATLQRVYSDRALYDAHVKTEVVPGIVKRSWGPFQEQEVGFDTAWRKASVWAFGIGIETYRFAFMSHKSKRLEALDPMTNHDNPHNNYLYILASFGGFGLLAYLWLLWRLLSQAFKRFYDPVSVGAGTTFSERAIAFGVVTSFFSYAVYSIAGFDSVACSVFFFFLLGCAAAYFEPSGTESPRKLLVGLQRHWRETRGQDNDVSSTPPVWATALVALLGIGLLGHTVIGGYTVYRAERAFVGDGPRSRNPQAYYASKIKGIQAAIALHPSESFYRQNLGSTYLEMMRMYRRQARQALKEDNRPVAQAAAQKLSKYAKQAKVALYSALAHAWAPENIYISLFQVYYQENDLEMAQESLRQALSHSPHLGAVRANLAALEFQTKDYEAAIADCEWVLSIEPKNPTAHRTLVQTYLALKKLDKAESALKAGQRRLRRDKALAQLAKKLAKAKAAAVKTTAPTP